MPVLFVGLELELSGGLGPLWAGHLGLKDWCCLLDTSPVRLSLVLASEEFRMTVEFQLRMAGKGASSRSYPLNSLPTSLARNEEGFAPNSAQKRGTFPLDFAQKRGTFLYSPDRWPVTSELSWLHRETWPRRSSSCLSAAWSFCHHRIRLCSSLSSLLSAPPHQMCSEQPVLLFLSLPLARKNDGAFLMTQAFPAENSKSLRVIARRKRLFFSVRLQRCVKKGVTRRVNGV